MKICPKCNAQLDDNTAFCRICGCNLAEAQQNQYQYQYNQAQYQPPQQAYDPYDHTNEFDSKDISDNKIMALMIYVGGVVGVIIALLAAKDSKFVGFHIRQYLKFFLVETVATFATIVLFWTFIVSIAWAALMIALLVFRIICIVQICKGQAKEGLLIRKIAFLK